MTRWPLLLLLVACPWLSSIERLPAEDFAFGDLTLSVPDGFTIERVAHAPLVERPIMADLDDLGHLYVADSSGSNADVETQLREKPHRIVRLEDTNSDGVYDHRIVFADQLMFPAGVLWAHGSLYVAAPPEIWKLTDSDDDGICDQREVWHDGKTLTGCANDLHGPYLGRDGWIYWCKGAFAEQTYPRPNGTPFVTRAAHVFRKHPQSGLVEPVMTGGMDNPVEVVFTPEGERFFTTTFLQHPGGGQRDGLIHAIYGGVYGKDHDVLDGHPRTGDLMPIMTHQGPAASCALLRYESQSLGADYQGNLFSSLFNMRQVMRHVLVPDGASYRTEDHEFLTGDHIDFHPTDVMEDADGSLLVIDTGGWYKLCCPTSQLPKPEVLGAIYRVRRTDHASIGDPLGKAMNWVTPSISDLVSRLSDARPQVVQRAVETLAARGNEAVPALAAVSGTLSTQHAIWALCQINTLEARTAARAFLKNSSPEVCHTALHAVSVHRDQAAASAVAALLTHSASPQVRRAAAEALGRIGDASHVPSLLAALDQPCDRVLEHSLRYALIEIGDEAALLATLDAPSDRARCVGLDTLFQLKSPQLTPGITFPYLAHEAPSIRKLAWKIVQANDAWMEALIDELPSPSELSHEAIETMPSLARQPAMQRYLTNALRDPPQQKAVLQIIERANLTEIPEAWLATFEMVLHSPVQATRLAALRSLKRVKHLNMSALHDIATNPASDAVERLHALTILTLHDPFPIQESMPFLIAHLHSNIPPQERQQALDVITNIPLSEREHLALAQSLDAIGPLELVRLTTSLLAALETDNTSHLVSVMLESLAKNPSAASLPPAAIQKLLGAAPDSPAKAAFAEQVPMTTLADQEARLQSVLQDLPPGDITRGQTVFNSSEAACVTCHAIGYRGGQLGPDLTRIGQIRSARDLLESILYPSASFVRSYEPLLVTTTDGQTHLGIPKVQNDQHVILNTGPASEAVLDPKQIQEIQPATVSLMPPGLDTIMSTQQLADLLSFLQNSK